MKKFKTKKRRKKVSKKYFLHLIIIILIFLLIKYLKNTYLDSLDNETIIEDIITTKFNNNINLDFKDKIVKDYFIKSDTLTTLNEIESSNIDIFIYTTHENESYANTFTEPYNLTPNIKTMTYILKDYLEEYNLNVYIEEESVTKKLKENNWSYKYSYDASSLLIKEKILNNTSLKLIIDLHRDSGSHKTTTLTYNNTDYAKILFVIGKEHSNYEKNYNVATKLNSIIEEELPNLSRGIILKSGNGVNGIYNQDLNPNNILLELGGEENELEELNNTLYILAKCINKYIGELS